MVVIKILRSALERLLFFNATMSRIHVVRSSVEISRTEYSIDSMKRSMKSRCGDVFVVLRWWVDCLIEDVSFKFNLSMKKLFKLN